MVYLGQPVSSADPHAYTRVVKLMWSANLVVVLSSPFADMIIASAVGLVTILLLVGALLQLTRKRAPG